MANVEELEALQVRQRLGQRGQRVLVEREHAQIRQLAYLAGQRLQAVGVQVELLQVGQLLQRRRYHGNVVLAQVEDAVQLVAVAVDRLEDVDVRLDFALLAAADYFGLLVARQYDGGALARAECGAGQRADAWRARF